MLTMEEALAGSSMNFGEGEIVKGKVIEVRNKEVLVDIGYKSEGYVVREEFGSDEEIEIGSKVQVMILDVEPNGEVVLSKRQADLELGWKEVLGSNKEGDRVKGRVVRKIKGGLLADIGVPVFLPASQIDIRRANEVGDYIGEEIEAEIIKIDTWSPAWRRGRLRRGDVFVEIDGERVDNAVDARRLIDQATVGEVR